MTSEDISFPRNWTRRSIGALICLSPIMVLLVSLVEAISKNVRLSLTSISVTCVAVGLSGLNFYLSFLRPSIWLRRRGTMEGFHRITGLPLIGTIFVMIGCIFGFGSMYIALIGLIAVCLDTGGLPWFLICTWKDSTLWDKMKLY